MLEIFCTILGLIQGVLVLLNKRSNWIVYAIQMAALVVFSFINKLYGDMVQNFFYMFICIASFFLWKEGKTFDRIRRLSGRSIAIIVAVAAVGIALIGHGLSLTDDPLPYLDASTTVTMVIALLLMSTRTLECWIVWFINDILYIIQYYSLPDQAFYLMMLNIIWTAMAVISFINWLKIYKSYSYETKK
jgi:nicotinamide mononucleotide transporter PnuC